MDQTLKNQLAYDLALKLQEEGVCKFVQCIDPTLKIEGVDTEHDELQNKLLANE